LRVYNRYGRRDNKYKARIKILVTETGIEEFTKQVEDVAVSPEEVARITAYFADPEFEALPDHHDGYKAKLLSDKDFANWVDNNLAAMRL